MTDHSYSDKELCRPALTWDLPQLRALDDPAATAFIDAFGPGPFNFEALSAAPENPLLIAARIVLMERGGRSAEAAPLYTQLGGSPWRDLLSACLRAWAPSSDDVSRIREALQALEAIDDDDLRPRVQAKLAGIAIDRNAHSLGADILGRAARAAPEGSRLRVLLRFVDAQLRERIPPFDALGGLPEDPLVEQDWIEAGALTASQEQLASIVKERARNPWSTAISFGRTPIDEIVAAEQQATWAGALWKRPQLRKQAGAQILLAGGTSEQLSYGLVMWIAGGGDDRQAMANFVEPRLRLASLEEVVAYFVDGDDVTEQRIRVIAELGLAWWDCVSPQMVGRLLDRLMPVHQHPVIRRDTFRLFASLAPRHLSEWEERFLKLPPTDRGAVSRLLDIQTIANARQDVVEAIAASLDDAPVDEFQPEGSVWLIRIAVANRTGEQIALPLSELSPADVLQIAEYSRESISDDRLRQTADQLVEAINRAVAEAREGRYGLGGVLPEALLGQAITLLGPTATGYVGVLTDLLQHPWYPAERRLAALTSLGIVAGEFGLSQQAGGMVRAAPVEVRVQEFSGISADVLRAGKLVALFSQLTDGDVAELVALARDDDARVRNLAINAAGLAYRTSPRAPVGQALVSALFDPEPSVIAWGLRELRSGVPEEFLPTVQRRVDNLMANFPRVVRAQAALLAAQLAQDNGEPHLEAALRLAQNDKSWAVRRVIAPRDGE